MFPCQITWHNVSCVPQVLAGYRLIRPAMQSERKGTGSSMDPWHGFKISKRKNAKEEGRIEENCIKKNRSLGVFSHSGMQSNQTAQLYILYDQS